MTQPDTMRTGRPGRASRIRNALPILILALGVPLTLAWIGGLAFAGYEAVSWLVEAVAEASP